MPHFRDNKARVRELLETENWREAIPELGLAPMALLNACLACLPQGSPVTARAAGIIGEGIATLADNPLSHEQARLFMRRLMWHMNEESGNVGWGIPEAFGEILAASPSMADEYHRVLISYIWDTGRDDNFCDQIVLRRSCHEAVLRLLEVRHDLLDAALDALTTGAASDPDPLCRQLAEQTLRRCKAVSSDQRPPA